MKNMLTTRLLCAAFNRSKKLDLWEPFQEHELRVATSRNADASFARRNAPLFEFESLRMSDSRSPSHRCPTCKSTFGNARNLAVFIDGTSNKPDDEKTNVVKLYKVASDGDGPGPQQRKVYLKGIDAHDKRSSSESLLSHAEKMFQHGLETAFARNIDKNIKSAYLWLANEYRMGDQIYLFGFSRGAYQVRALASMIHEVGLVAKMTQQERLEQTRSNRCSTNLNHPTDATREQLEETDQNHRTTDPNVHKETILGRIDEAYLNYRSNDPNDPETRKKAIEFKKKYSWPGVRIHFVGVWDTVSSLGFIKQDVHITSSTSVSNACHFRHALALDECRVKFMPEYFTEVNAHRTEIESPRPCVGDIKEVWFAGHHSDVGGTSRRCTSSSADDGPYPTHAGNVPLLWMKREAIASGLVFELDGLSWNPKDVDLGREDAMNWGWKVVETLPIRHQVSFSGTGEHVRRWHLSRPRSVIPQQHIHSSILSSDVYTPYATLRGGLGIPTVPRVPSSQLWVTELPYEEVIISAFIRSLRDQKSMLRPFERVLSLLSCNNWPTPDSPLSEQSVGNQPDRRSEASISKQYDFARFVHAIIHDIASNFSASDELVKNAQYSLIAILSSPSQPRFPETLDVLRFTARNKTLRRRFIAHEEVSGALLHALERTNEHQREDLFPLVMEILCYLIHDSDQRDSVINQLNTSSAVSKTGKTRLSLVLEVKADSHLMASLKMIASLARYEPFLCESMAPRIVDLAKKRSGVVGSAAVEALVVLKGQLIARDIRFSNILGYFENTLPRLDVEEGGTSSPQDWAPEYGLLSEEVVRNLTRTIESRDAHQRTIATLTLLKLLKLPDELTIWNSCPSKKVLDTFMKQMEKKETSLLAAYAVKTCLKHDMWKPDDIDIPRAAQLIVNMFDKGWFDDAVGQVEGAEIFRELMMNDNLRQQVIKAGILTTFIKKFEDGEHHDVRMSLIGLDIISISKNCHDRYESRVEWERRVVQELRRFVNKSLAALHDKKKMTQMKGVRVLSALAQTAVGEEAIKPRVTDIVTMLLPHADKSSIPRSQLFGPTAALHNLCRNETLRKEIEKSPEYAEFKGLYRKGTLYPQLRSDQRANGAA